MAVAVAALGRASGAAACEAHAHEAAPEAALAAALAAGLATQAAGASLQAQDALSKLEWLQLINAGMLGVAAAWGR